MSSRDCGDFSAGWVDDEIALVLGLAFVNLAGNEPSFGEKLTLKLDWGSQGRCEGEKKETVANLRNFKINK